MPLLDYVSCRNTFNSGLTCCYDPGPHFSFSGPPIYYPKTFFAIQPLVSHLPSSHMVPRSTIYPPGLPRHPLSPLATRYPIVHLNREPYLLYPYCSLFLALTSLLHILSLALTSLKSHHSIVLPIRSRDLSLEYKPQYFDHWALSLTWFSIQDL